MRLLLPETAKRGVCLITNMGAGELLLNNFHGLGFRLYKWYDVSNREESE